MLGCAPYHSLAVANPMTRVHWPDVDSSTFEEMGSALIKGMHPDAQRIDGSGGDQGREIQITKAEGLDFYQLKSFTGRVDAKSGRRRQVEKSLATAGKQHPISWSLVVPIDPTPGELRWFDGLRRNYPFPLHWLGKNWLDTHLADQPGLVRYFIHRGADEAARWIKDLREEEAGLLNGVPDALNRAKRIVDQLNDLDPYYRFEITVGEGKHGVRPIPKYPGAEKDSPISASLEVQLPDTPEGRARMEELRSAFEYGTGLTITSDELKMLRIEGPAGFGGVFSDGTLVAEPAQDPDWSLPGRLLLVDPGGATIGALPVVFSERTIGTKGFTVTAWDRTRTFRVKQRVDGTTATGEASYEFEVPADAYPGLVLPVLRFLHRMKEPNRLVFEVDGHRTSGGATLNQEPIVPDQYLELIEALDRLQAATTTYFAIPEDFTKDEVEAIFDADQLLRGEALPFTWKDWNISISSQAGLDALLHDEPAHHSWRTVHPDYALTVSGHELHLGQFHTTLDGATADNLDKLRATPKLLRGQERPVRLVPLGDRNGGAIRLGPAPQDAPTTPE